MSVLPDETFNPVAWRDGTVELLDQRKLPGEEVYLTLDTASAVAAAIRDMVVRGAPAIGIAAAYGVVLAASRAIKNNAGDWKQVIEPELQELSDSRPTAVNLHWALQRMRRCIDSLENDQADTLLQEAIAIHAEDTAANRRMGELGSELIGKTTGVLTHCNAGALATGGYGTALGVVRSLFATQKLDMVYACETRPWLQGARLTAWELQHDHIPVTVITDSAAASILKSGKISWVIVGADRVAANGDVANKIGTYGLAVMARHHGIRFMVAAPVSTIDPDTASGDAIQIEQRSGSELGYMGERKITPDDTKIYNPVFDITPADLVDFLVTERGYIERPNREKIQALLAS